MMERKVFTSMSTSWWLLYRLKEARKCQVFLGPALMAWCSGVQLGVQFQLDPEQRPHLFGGAH